MGFNSVVFMCNDAMNTVDEDPKGWWEKTWQNLCTLPWKKTKTYGHGYHANGFQAVWNQHADMTGVILVGGNHATVLGGSCRQDHHTEEGQIEILKDILKQNGYTVSIRKKKSNG